MFFLHFFDLFFFFATSLHFTNHSVYSTTHTHTHTRIHTQTTQGEVIIYETKTFSILMSFQRKGGTTLDDAGEISGIIWRRCSNAFDPTKKKKNSKKNDNITIDGKNRFMMTDDGSNNDTYWLEIIILSVNGELCRRAVRITTSNSNSNSTSNNEEDYSIIDIENENRYCNIEFKHKNIKQWEFDGINYFESNKYKKKKQKNNENMLQYGLNNNNNIDENKQSEFGINDNNNNISNIPSYMVISACATKLVDTKPKTSRLGHATMILTFDENSSDNEPKLVKYYNSKKPKNGWFGDKSVFFAMMDRRVKYRSRKVLFCVFLLICIFSCLCYLLSILLFAFVSDSVCSLFCMFLAFFLCMFCLFCACFFSFILDTSVS